MIGHPAGGAGRLLVEAGNAKGALCVIIKEDIPPLLEEVFNREGSAIKELQPVLLLISGQEG